MSNVLEVVQVVAVLLMVTPLVIAAVFALRRSSRKIDQILREECGQDTPVPEVHSSTAARPVGQTIGAPTRSAGGSPTV
jgi:hypothetical protein